MGDKISTIILKVDLECRKCNKKIRKTICKLQERESIQTVNFDDKNNTVTISGPFDPKKLCKKLCCKASKVIKDIQIKEEEKPKPKEDKPKQKDKKPKEDKPPPPPAKVEVEVEVEIDYVAQELCTCGRRPWYEGCYGGYKCPWCGKGYGWPPAICAAPPPYPYGGYNTCTYICEDPQPSCSIM